jgi:cob(I)alamin adenosyltransferase
MDDDKYRKEIVWLEAQIDDLAATIESCRKFILAGRIAVASGGVILITMLVGVTDSIRLSLHSLSQRCSEASLLQARTVVRRKRPAMN